MTPGAHQQLKGLGAVKTGNNLRDHMSDLELIFTMLGEAGTIEIARKPDARVSTRIAALRGKAVRWPATRRARAGSHRQAGRAEKTKAACSGLPFQRLRCHRLGAVLFGHGRGAPDR